MSSLVLWRQARPHIRVRLRTQPRPCCAALCGVGATTVIVWMRPGTLEAREICEGHRLLLQGNVPALFFPIGHAPSLKTIADAVAAEIRRRRKPQFVATWTTGNTTMFRFTTP